jgi:hypothetical protein
LTAEEKDMFEEANVLE